jgi:hypothetical protein
MMSNYGIKRMLPRLIIAAIAVNLSYIICQGAVDLSNILGYNIYDAFHNIAANLPQVLGDSSQNINTQTSSGFGGLITVILVGGAVVWAFVGFGSAIISVVLITLLTVLVMLLLRKAFIVLLIVLSPMAFVAYLLPNTEKYFEKWWKGFFGLLMLFPIVAMLLGAGTLVSGIILRAGLQQNQSAQCQAGQKIDPDTGNVCAEGTFSPTVNGVAVKGQAPWSLGLIAVGSQIALLGAIPAAISAAFAGLGAGVKALHSATRKGAGGAVGYGRDKWKNSDLSKYMEHKEHERDIQIRAGTYRGNKILHPIRGTKTSMNKLLRTKGANTGIGGFKNLTAQGVNQKEAKESIDKFEGDADFMRAWVHAHGDEGKARALLEAEEEGSWSEERSQRFKSMVQNGLHHSAGSYMAAADGIVSHGKGNIEDIIHAVEAAKGADPGVSAFSMFEAARGNARKAGRADLVGDLEAMKKKAYTDTTVRGGTEGTMTAISQMGVPSLHYEMFKDSNPYYHQNMEAFAKRLEDPTNIAGAVAGLMKADGRVAGSRMPDGRSMEKFVMDEAARRYGAVRADGSPITSLQDANNFLEGRIQPPSP